jgi:hypothetical protein
LNTDKAHRTVTHVQATGGEPTFGCWGAT